MGLTCIMGRASTEKTHYIMGKIRESLLENGEHPLILIVPEQFTLQAERDLIESQNLDGILRAEVLSFTRLAYRVFNEVGGLSKTPINDIGKSIIIKKILEESKQDLTIYKNISRQEGFVSRLKDIICEFKQQGIIPMDIIQSMDKIDENSILKMKMTDIAYIYNKFNSYLEDRYVDNEDHLNLLIDSIEKASFLEGAEIWIDGFHLFTPQTLRIIEKLLLVAKEVYITFTMELEGGDRDRDLFHLPHNTFLRVKEMAQGLKIDHRIVDLDHDREMKSIKADEISHIEQEFFSYPYKEYTKEVNNLNVFAGSNLYSEIEYIAREIVKLVREEGYRYKDIVVLSGNFENYRETIKRSFTEYGIPFFMDEKRGIMDHPIIELILASLEIIIKNYPSREVFRLIKTGFTDLTKDEGEILENYALGYGIRGKGWVTDFSKGNEGELEELNRIRQKLISPLENLEKKIKKIKSSKKITKSLFVFLQEIKAEEKLDLLIEDLEAEGRFDFVNENTQIWNTVMEIFDQIHEILGESTISLKSYLKLLESGFSACEIGVIPSTTDQVLIGSIERSRSHGIKAVFIVGVNDGVLPPAYEEDGILLDNERTSLEELGLELAARGGKKIFQDNLSIYLALAKPKCHLCLTYPLGDEEGRAKRPSILIDRVKKVFPKLRVQGDNIGEAINGLDLISSPEGTFKYLVENLGLYVNKGYMDTLWWDVYGWYYKENQWETKRNLILQGLFHENQVKYIDKSKVRNLYNIPIRTSVSRLERFVNCPFSHFISYGLRPKERKIYEIKGPDVGKIFHYSIEKFAKKTREKNINWREMEECQSDEMVEEVMAELAENFEHGIMQSTHRYQYLLRRLTRVSKKAFWTLIEHIKKGEFIPYGHEIPFGEGHRIPAILIELEDGEILYLEGRIDRIDILRGELGNYFKIIDYKSGNQQFNLSDVYYGLQLQLLVYLEAAMSIREKFNPKPNHPAGVLYFKIDDPMIKTSLKAPDEIEKEIDKQLKMKGLVVNDLKIIRAMDKEIVGSSNLIPVSINKDNSLGKISSVATEQDFKNLISHIRNLIREIGREILKGNINIEPHKQGKETSCKYCEYLAICQFDNIFQGNTYRLIKELKAHEVLERLRKEDEVDEKLD